jgi:hypothetical protein
VGEWTRDRAKWLAGMVVVAAVGISLVVAVDDMEVKGFGGFVAVLGLAGVSIALFWWKR